MPKITINEIDNTQPGSTEYKNFSVLVLGPAKVAERQTWEDVKAALIANGFDENLVKEYTDPDDFLEEVGAVKTGSDNWYANQLAYLLLNLGYTVVYKAVEKLDDLEVSKTYVELEDKNRYDFRYIINGLATANVEANKAISALATDRSDCVALCEVDTAAYEATTDLMAAKITKIYEEVTANGNANKYTAYFANRVHYNAKALPNKKIGTASVYDNDTYFPAIFHYLACTAKASVNYAEWYAVAGFNRGTSDYVVESIKVDFGEHAINALQPRTPISYKKEVEGQEVDARFERAVNLVVKIKKDYYLWGNRTMAQLEGEIKEEALKASHFLNIRQLCTTIKKQLYVSCRKYTFDPNSDILWFNFKNEISKLLDTMKADQGIRDYKITKVKSDKKATFKANIRIVPIEAVEDFDITLYLEDAIAGTVALDESED